MGQQQLLLLILGVIIVGIAVIVGITMFGAGSAQGNKDGITSGLMTISANAHEYKIRPRTLGGGRPSYQDYQIPIKLRSDENAQYEVLGTPSAVEVQIRATSSMDAGWTATCIIDSSGAASISYSGW